MQFGMKEEDFEELVYYISRRFSKAGLLAESFPGSGNNLQR
jgi:hypothetical protein